MTVAVVLSPPRERAMEAQVDRAVDERVSGREDGQGENGLAAAAKTVESVKVSGAQLRSNFVTHRRNQSALCVTYIVKALCAHWSMTLDVAGG